MAAVARVIRREDGPQSLTDPLRRRLLETLQSQAPASAATLARATGLKRQAVNYHLRQMEAAGRGEAGGGGGGVVEAVGERRKGACTERLVQATAATYLISPEVLGRLATDPAQIGDTMSWAY